MSMTSSIYATVSRPSLFLNPELCKMSFRILLSIILLSGIVRAQIPEEQIRIEQFKQAFDDCNYPKVMRMGKGLVKEYPEDDMIHSKYAHACYRLGEFHKVIHLKGTYPSCMMILTQLEDPEYLPYIPDAYEVTKQYALALIASKRTKVAAFELAKLSRFEDPKIQFLLYMLNFLYEKEGVDQMAPDAIAFIENTTNPSLIIYSQRYIPLLHMPHLFDIMYESAVNQDEKAMLCCCAGLGYIKNGDGKKGRALLSKALDLDNPGHSESIPVAFLAHYSPDTLKFKKTLNKRLKASRWKQIITQENKLGLAFMESGYAEIEKILDQLIVLEPDNYAWTSYRGFLYMVFGEWQKAVDMIEKELSSQVWDHENKICSKMYLPVLYRLLKNPEKEMEALKAAKMHEEEEGWRLLISAIESPVIFNNNMFAMFLKPNHAVVWLALKALNHELNGKYIEAEETYLSIMSNDGFSAYLEYQLAMQRLRIVSPLAAIQAM